MLVVMLCLCSSCLLSSRWKLVVLFGVSWVMIGGSLFCVLIG